MGIGLVRVQKETTISLLQTMETSIMILKHNKDYMIQNSCVHRTTRAGTLSTLGMKGMNS